jgi:serine protease inhibitor
VVITRRNVLALAAVAALAGCGRSAGESDLVRSDRPRAADAPAAKAASVTAVSAFSAGLYAALAQSAKGNVVCSPYSAALVLAMTAQGAKGVTAQQILKVLHSVDAAALADGMNSIGLDLATRSGSVPDPNGGKARRIELAAANSLWGQSGLSWQKPFLDVLARDFGAGMRVVDYKTKTEAARSSINSWVSQQTAGRIPEVIAPGVLTTAARLTLANALYLKAPWQTQFVPGMTRRMAFHRLDGSTVGANTMTEVEAAQRRFASGAGWQAVDSAYAGGKLALAVVLPDAGHFARVEKSLTGDWLTQLLAAFRPAMIWLKLPRWSSRTKVELREPLTGMGMPIPFSDAADFSAMTSQEPLKISAMPQESFISVDEAGTEAAASTAGSMGMTGGVSARWFFVDRPFLYVIHDVPTGTPLFIGRVLDPTITA